MKMHCCKCHTFLGDMAKGSKYKKDMYFLCSLCKGAMDLSNTASNNFFKKGYDMPKGFDDIFGGFGGK